MLDQTPFPIPIDLSGLFARPMKDTKPSPLEEGLNTMLKGGIGQDELAPTAFDRYRYLMQQAGLGPSKNDLNAGTEKINADAAEEIRQRLQEIMVPQRQPMSYPNVSALNLPSVPQRQPGHAEPVSSIAAGLLGLVSPNNAGEFGAAALHGALKGQQQQYEDAQAKYQQDFQQSVAKHADEIRRENARAEIENENKVIGYENSVAKTKSDKESALEANNASRLQGMSTFLQGIADKVRGPRQAQSQADDVLLQYEEEQKVKARKEKNFLTAAEISERIKSTEALHEQTAAQREMNRLEMVRYHNLSHEDRQRAIDSGMYRGGYTPTPGGPPTPTPTVNLPHKTQAEIDKLKADAARAKNLPDQNSGWASLELRKQNEIKGTAEKELDKLHARNPGGSLSKDPVTLARIKALWDTWYAARDAIKAVDTSPRLPKNQRMQNPAGVVTPGAFKSPGGISFTVK